MLDTERRETNSPWALKSWNAKMLVYLFGIILFDLSGQTKHE